MGQVFYRAPKHQYPTVVKAEGVYLYDEDGKQYLDASGGAAVSCLGHGNEYVIEAIKSQLDTVAYAHTAFFTNTPQEELAGRLAAHFGTYNAKVYFLSGGSEANETAIKLARQYWVACGRYQKSVIISRDQSYHGNTLATLSMSGNPSRKRAFKPMLHDWPKALPCHAYRYQRADESTAKYSERCALSLEAEILKVGAENVAAFIAEPIVGATIGCVAATAGYFKKIREICDRYDILLILDEVMCGAGRSGSYFAFEQENILPDIVTLAKGLGGGYQPLAAVICKANIHDHIVKQCGSFEHGHTYIGHAAACAAGLAVMDVIENEKLLSKVQHTGKTLMSHLKSSFQSHPNIGDIRGRGLFIALEFTLDKDHKKPPGIALDLPKKLKNSAMKNGLICYPGGGTADGINGAHILLAPPFIYEDSHVSELIEKLQRIIEEQTFA
ncbi:Aminotransferase, class III [hydrothermal vent metagenome]|uniref:Aminotransferase, class III n=1 Tax=hydrothermal vent metagenome TaxID=652676 RepID=A0A3B1B6C5_9ZZZZ